MVDPAAAFLAIGLWHRHMEQSRAKSGIARRIKERVAVCQMLREGRPVGGESYCRLTFMWLLIP